MVGAQCADHQASCQEADGLGPSTTRAVRPRSSGQLERGVTSVRAGLRLPEPFAVAMRRSVSSRGARVVQTGLGRPGPRGAGADQADELLDEDRLSRLPVLRSSRLSGPVSLPPVLVQVGGEAPEAYSSPDGRAR